MMESKSHNTPPDAARGHETRDANFKSVLLSGAALFGLMVVGLLFSLALYIFFQKETAQPGAHPSTFTQPQESTMPAKPRVQPDPHASLLTLRKAEDSVLTSYGWIGNDSTMVRVPIDRAMDMLVNKGLPVQTSK